MSGSSRRDDDSFKAVVSGAWSICASGQHLDRTPVDIDQGFPPACWVARCSTDQQDLTAQRDGLLGLGVEGERIHVDNGLTGTTPERPGLREALAACRAGDTLVVTKLDRLARSLPDARAIADELTARQISLSLGGSVYDPTDAVGRLLFNILAMVAQFESDLIRLRTVEGMKVAKAKGRLRGNHPKLDRKQEAHWAPWWAHRHPGADRDRRSDPATSAGRGRHRPVLGPPDGCPAKPAPRVTLAA
jgi:hypothetical protein